MGHGGRRQRPSAESLGGHVRPLRPLEVRACALMLQMAECGDGDLPDGVGSIALPIAQAMPAAAEAMAAGRGGGGGAGGSSGSPSKERGGRAPVTLMTTTKATGAAGTGATTELSLERAAMRQPLEPMAVAMMQRVLSHGVPRSRAAVHDHGTGVVALLEARWPRTLKHLLAICQRDDLADVSRRWEGKRPPRATLERVVDEEWVTHAFVGALPREALLWAWDQFVLQGWHLTAELAAACLYLMRREVRRLDEGSAGATELRGAMQSQLHTDANLAELQALLAAASAETRGRASADGVRHDARPQVMCRVPMIQRVHVHTRGGAAGPVADAVVVEREREI